ncbi:hypothetical protein T484DRAFT_3166334 [Baffinella frigidus]|nr:hypothetical protein T484DRAFT_3166334 [Cryptophyta sp. CCMP2293]
MPLGAAEGAVRVRALVSVRQLSGSLPRKTRAVPSLRRDGGATPNSTEMGANLPAVDLGSGTSSCPSGQFWSSAQGSCKGCPAGSHVKAGIQTCDASDYTGGRHRGTAVARVGAMASETSGWKSDSSMRCLSSGGVQTLRVAATAAARVGSETEGMAYDTSCTSCLAGTYSTAGSSACTPCPAGTGSASGSDNLTDCKLLDVSCGDELCIGE